jgi:hypothetical protein
VCCPPSPCPLLHPNLLPPHLVDPDVCDLRDGAVLLVLRGVALAQDADLGGWGFEVSGVSWCVVGRCLYAMAPRTKNDDFEQQASELLHLKRRLTLSPGRIVPLIMRPRASKDRPSCFG